jgi:endonuclease III
MLLNISEPSEILEGIADVKATFGTEARTIDGWRASYMQDLATSRQQSDITIFNSVVNSLLERAMSGETWARRHDLIADVYLSFNDVNEQTALEIIKKSGYRFPTAGIHVIMKAKELVCNPGFSWESYFQEADEQYETDFLLDPFLGIKGVGYKTRDLALSEFSDRFVALDLHVVRVTTRTGLFLHGYGDTRITTDVSTEAGYLFFHNVILKLSYMTCWPRSGYSPGEIDRMLWYFGRTICRATPLCQSCPITQYCLTARRRDSGTDLESVAHHE